MIQVRTPASQLFKLLVRPALIYYKTKTRTLPTPSLAPSSTKKGKAMQAYTSQRAIDLANEVVQLPLKQFAVKVHHLLVSR